MFSTKSFNDNLLRAYSAPPLLTNCPTVRLGFFVSICGFGMTDAIELKKFVKSVVTTLLSKSIGRLVGSGFGITGTYICYTSSNRNVDVAEPSPILT
jgi:hypothetical protein